MWTGSKGTVFAMVEIAQNFVMGLRARCQGHKVCRAHSQMPNAQPFNRGWYHEDQSWVGDILI